MPESLVSPVSSTTAFARRGHIDSPELTYYGGKILENPRFVSIYAGGYWDTQKGRADRSWVDQCSASVPKGPHSSVWAEYGVNPGAFVGSAVVKMPVGQKFVVDRDIQALVAKALRQSGISKPDGSTVYTVFLPPKVVLQDGDADSRRGLGGFHGSYVDPATRKKVYYAAIVYADGANGIPFTQKPVDNITIAASHEWSEAVTDPDVNHGKLGWYNRTFGEIGDIPVMMRFPLSTLWGRVEGCAVQKEWSNAEGKPVLTVK